MLSQPPLSCPKEEGDSRSAATGCPLAAERFRSTKSLLEASHCADKVPWAASAGKVPWAAGADKVPWAAGAGKVPWATGTDKVPWAAGADKLAGFGGIGNGGRFAGGLGGGLGADQRLLCNCHGRVS